ncbi:unnamed protein product, partial [Agarophyton chilense]
CRHAARVVLQARHAARALALVRTLRAAADHLATAPDVIVPLHVDFLAVCLQAKCYALAARWLRRCSRLRPDGATAVSATDVHLLFHYAAVVFVGVKDYPAALHSCRLALAVPAPAPGPFLRVAVATFRYYVLLHLLVAARSPPPFNFCSYALPLLRNRASEYVQLATAFERMDAAHMRTVFESHRAAFEAHATLGVVKQVMQTFTDALVHRLTNSYVTIKLQHVAARVAACHDQPDAHDVLLRMIQRGTLCARIDDRKRVLRLLHEQQLQQSVQVLQRVEMFRQHVRTDPAYVGKMLGGSSSRNAGGGSSARATRRTAGASGSSSSSSSAATAAAAAARRASDVDMLRLSGRA